MNTELQNKAWSVLPKEFKEEVKKMFQKDINTCNNMNQAMRCILVDLFGIHNLTSGSENLSEPKPGKPKFKIGDKVKHSAHPHADGIYRVDDIRKSSDGFIYHIQGLIGISNVKESDLEPYTEPEKESRNLSKNIANCDKQFDNILKDSFSKERRLNIATQIMSSILSNRKMLNNLAHGETTTEGVVKRIVNTTMMYTDALIAECEEGGKS